MGLKGPKWEKFWDSFSSSKGDISAKMGQIWPILADDFSPNGEKWEVKLFGVTIYSIGFTVEFIGVSAKIHLQVDFSRRGPSKAPIWGL